jgi:two-component system, NarL family, sensor kinase
MNMKQNEVFLVFILGTLFLFAFAIALISFLIQYKRKQQLHITEKMNLEYQFQQQLLQSRLEVQEQSLKYFSEEIHDNIGQALTLCKLHLHQLPHAEESDKDLLLEESTAILTKALNDMRSISHTLNGNYVSRMGLKESLEKETKYISSSRKVRTELIFNGEVANLPQEKELLIFRIIQECITNALKHGAPGTLSIELDYQPYYLSICIADDGTGFNTVDVKEPGLGLSNMQLRTTLLNGTMEITSKENEGTRINLKIPLDNAN